MRTLAAAGVVHSEGLLKSLIAAYQREAEDAVADGYAVAMINALKYQRHEEEIAVQTFAGAAGPQLGPRLGGHSRRRPKAHGCRPRRTRMCAR